MSDEGSRVLGAVNGALFAVVGATDMAVRTTTRALTEAHGVVGRSPLSGVARAAQHEVASRGSALLGRWTVPPDHHLEALARQAARDRGL
jgi:hypothetical protein